MPGKSFAEYLVAQGHDVWCIDWGTPGDEDRYLTFDEICDGYIGRAMRKAARSSPRGKAHMLGYCLGGTLTTIYGARRPEHVASMLALASPVSFSDDDGLLSTWTRTPTFDLDALIEGAGNVPWPLLQASFHMLRPTMYLSKATYMLDRAWDDQFLDGFFAIETWSNDNVSFPGECYRRYIQELYREDRLIRGEFALSGVPVDLADITFPVLAITFLHDHIVPLPSAAPLIEAISSQDKQLLKLSGGTSGRSSRARRAGGCGRPSRSGSPSATGTKPPSSARARSRVVGLKSGAPRRMMRDAADVLLARALAARPPTPEPPMKNGQTLDDSLAPGFLIASPRLDGSPFERALIVIVHHDDEGAMGFIVNKPLSIDLGSLLQSADEALTGEITASCYDTHVHFGGPVQVEQLWLIYNDPTQARPPRMPGLGKQGLSTQGRLQFDENWCLIADSDSIEDFIYGHRLAALPTLHRVHGLGPGPARGRDRGGLLAGPGLRGGPGLWRAPAGRGLVGGAGAAGREPDGIYDDGQGRQRLRCAEAPRLCPRLDQMIPRAIRSSARTCNTSRGHTMLFPKRRPSIQLKSPEEIEGMRRAGRLASRCLEHIVHQIEPGMTTQDLDDMQMAFAEEHGARPAPLHYKGFPKSICTSINEVICHGIPSQDVVLREGDIIGVDVTLVVDGFHGDNATTIPVGEVDEEAQRLMYVTLHSLKQAIEKVARAAARGSRLGDPVPTPRGATRFGVVRDFVGHGIGRSFHEEPQVPHVGKPRTGTRLRPNMTFTIEPMVNEGTWKLKVLDDGWTAITLDGKRSAQYEHTIAVTEEGFEIMTVQNDDGTWEPPGRFEIAEPRVVRQDNTEHKEAGGACFRKQARPGPQ